MRVILIGEDGNRIGEVSMDEAELEAKKAGKDLMMVAKNVYRIADAGKLKYEQKQRQKQQRAQRRTHKVKEIKLGLLTDEHDLNVKLRHIEDFLKRGMKTKITMKFKGRQMAFRDAGMVKMKGLVEPLVSSGLADMDKEPAFEGRNLVAFLVPSKKQQK